MAELVDKKVQVPKEMSEMFEALVGIISDIKKGKDMVAIVGGNLQKLSVAIDGADKIVGEFGEATPEAITATGILAADVVKALSAKAPEA